MNVSYKPQPNLLLEFDAKGVKDYFEQRAVIDEIVKQDTCGKCGGKDISYNVREVDGNKFYEMKCQSCGAALGFGCHKVGGTLFPQRKDKEKGWLPDSGWVKWNPATESKE